MKLKSLTGLFLALLSMALGLESSAYAQSYPNHSVRLIVAFSAGGSADALGRIVAQKLSKYWGQQVTVENRTGSLDNIGVLAAARSAPGGYTLHFATQSVTVNVTLS